MFHYKFQAKSVCLLFFAALSMLVSAATAFAQQAKEIEAIDILGNDRLTDEEITKVIKSRPGEPFDEKRVQDDLEALLDLGIFEPANTKVNTEAGLHGGVNVIFEVMELPLIAEIRFAGLGYVTKAELLTELQRRKAGLAVNSPYRRDNFRKAQQIITEYLKTRGFADAKVSLAEEDASRTTVILSIFIKELPNDNPND